jgi:hypothetical protein
VQAGPPLPTREPMTDFPQDYQLRNCYFSVNERIVQNSELIGKGNIFGYGGPSEPCPTLVFTPSNVLAASTANSKADVHTILCANEFAIHPNILIVCINFTSSFFFVPVIFFIYSFFCISVNFVVYCFFSI